MGGRFSVPAPTVIRVPNPNVPNVSGISIGQAQGCAGCSIQVPRGVSSSSATITRGAGANSTKAIITPGMAFPIKFKGRDKETDVQVNKLVLFHPSPMRIDNVQHDAVLMLNDPFDQGTNVVILIPLKGSISAGQSGAFVGKVAPFISGILQPDATTKAYPSISIPTGNDWDLTKVLPVTPNPSTNTVEVNSGYFVWGGIPAMEEYVVPGSNPWFTRYDWRTVGVAPTYIMLKNPIEINSFDLQTIRMLPVTPSAGAIHSPAMTTLTYKPGPAGTDVVGCAASSGTTRETFANGCDPLENIGEPSGTFRLDSGQVITTLSTLIGIIAGVIAVYFAMKMSVHPKYGLIFGALAAKLGRAMSGATAAAPPPSNARPPRPDARAPRSTSATPRPGSVLAGKPPGSTVEPSLSPEQVKIAVASEPDESKFDIQNPMRSTRRTTPSRAPVDTRVRNSLQGFRAPRSRAPSLTPSQRETAANEEPVSAPVLSPEQIDVALDEEPNPAAGTGILPGSVVAPPIGQASTREETDQEKAAREREEVKNAERSEAKAKAEAEADAKAEAKGLEAAAKRKADVQARKAEESKAEEKKKEEDKKKAEAKKKEEEEEEEKRLAAKDAEAKQRAEDYARLSDENKKKVDAQQSKFKEQKETLDKTFAKLVRQKKVAEAKAEDNPTPVNQQAVKEATVKVKQNEQEQKSLSSKVRALFSRSSRPAAPPKVPSASSSGKTHLSARATAPERGTESSWAQPTTARVTKPKGAPPPPPREKTAAEKLREAQREGQLLRMRAPKGSKGGKNTRKNKHRK